MEQRELHIELLLGRQVLAQDGQRVGRIEEVCAEDSGGDLIVTEYHVGTAAALERLSVSLLGRGVLNLFGRGQATRGYRVPWDKLDLARAGKHLRLDCARSELEELSGAAAGGRKRRTKTKKR